MKLKVFFVLIAVLALAGSGVVFAANKAVKGYAWSENIGWIHFNPDKGGVFIDDQTGNFSGYAWSENIGWIHFNPSGPFPEAPNYNTKVDLGTGKLTGWAKAVAGGTAGSGGWDGWIKMYEAGTEPAQIDTSTGEFSGWAWGSDVVGWISFSGSNYKASTTLFANLPVINFSAAPNPVAYNVSSILSWNVTDATSCSASGDWSGAKTLSGSESTGNLIDTKTYILTCVGPGGSSSKTVIVNIDPSTMPNFSLISSGSLLATIIQGGDTVSNTIKVKVVGVVNGFDSDVALSDISAGGFNVSIGDSILEASEYGAGSEIYVDVPGNTPSGTYTITIRGAGGGLTRDININLRVETLDSSKWQEI